MLTVLELKNNFLKRKKKNYYTYLNNSIQNNADRISWQSLLSLKIASSKEKEKWTAIVCYLKQIVATRWNWGRRKRKQDVRMYKNLFREDM